VSSSGAGLLRGMCRPPVSTHTVLCARTVKCEESCKLLEQLPSSPASVLVVSMMTLMSSVPSRYDQSRNLAMDMRARVLTSKTTHYLACSFTRSLARRRDATRCHTAADVRWVGVPEGVAAAEPPDSEFSSSSNEFEISSSSPLLTSFDSVACADTTGKPPPPPSEDLRPTVVPCEQCLAIQIPWMSGW
jgi:hypothetical protein